MKKIITIAVALVSGLTHFAVAAAPFPEKPVRIVVPYAAGGPFDGLLRGLAQELGDTWKQPVIIDNRPGGNEVIGANIVAKSSADGYTLLATSESGIMLNALLFSKLPYNPDKDLIPVSRLVQVPMVLVVPQAFPANTLKEFVEVARRRATNPVSYGSSGVGGATHLPLAMLAKDNGLNMTHIPYKGAAPLVQDMIGGQIELGAVAASVVEQHIKAGRLKGLAVSAPSRLTSLPQVPTFAETGVKDVQAEFMIGLAAPTGTPNDVVEHIAAKVHQILLQPAFKAKFLDPFAFTAVGSTPSEFKAYLAKDRSVQAERVKVSGASLD